MRGQGKESAREQEKEIEHMQLGDVSVFDSGQGTTGNCLNQLVKTVAPSIGVLDKLPIGETVKGIIRPEEKDEKKDTTKK